MDTVATPMLLKVVRSGKLQRITTEEVIDFFVSKYEAEPDDLKSSGVAALDEEFMKAPFQRENGPGTAAAPKLTGIANKYDSAKIESLLESRTAAMRIGGMGPVDLKQEDLDALVTYQAC